jgi:hypothetical protein
MNKKKNEEKRKKGFVDVLANLPAESRLQKKYG